MSEFAKEMQVLRANIAIANQLNKAVAYVYTECNKLLNKHPDNVQLLVYKARLIQMMAEGSDTLLANAKASLELALKIDPEYIPALIEMGWFIFVHDDDAKKASRYFLKAMKLATSYGNSCARWITDCVKEMQLKPGHGHKKKTSKDGQGG